jgi:hypothetical protein
MGCGNEPNDADDKAVEESINGENCEPAPELFELPAPESTPALPQPDVAAERWDRIESISNEYSGINVEKVIEPEVALGNPRDLIANADRDTVIISHGPPVPLFATDFQNSGQELSKSIPDYPKDWPEVKVYTPVLPTKENLERMIQGYAPLSPWGEKINLHHYEQNPKGPLMMIEEKFHHEVPHYRGGLAKDEREIYNRIQRPNIYKMAAETYLGKLIEDFKDAIEREEEENEK